MKYNALLYYCLVLFLLILVVQPVAGQDHEIRNGATLQMDIVKDLKFGYTTELRWLPDQLDETEWVNDLTATYDLSKKFSVIGLFRYTMRSSESPNRQRYSLGMGYDDSDKRWEWGAKVRYQYDRQANNENPRSTIRYKATIGYARKKWKLNPFLFSELFQNLLLQDRFTLLTLRTGLGTKVELSKKSSLNLELFLSQDLNDRKDKSMIYCVEYRYRL